MKIEEATAREERDLLNSIVFDKITQEKAVVIQINPIKIQLDREEEVIVPRTPEDLLIYIYEKEDIKEIKKRAEFLSKKIK